MIKLQCAPPARRGEEALKAREHETAKGNDHPKQPLGNHQCTT